MNFNLIFIIIFNSNLIIKMKKKHSTLFLKLPKITSKADALPMINFSRFQKHSKGSETKREKELNSKIVTKKKDSSKLYMLNKKSEYILPNVNFSKRLKDLIVTFPSELHVYETMYKERERFKNFRKHMKEQCFANLEENIEDQFINDLKDHISNGYYTIKNEKNRTIMRDQVIEKLKKNSSVPSFNYNNKYFDLDLM